MATNLQANGHTINIVAGGSITSGDVDVIGNLHGVALNSGESGDTIVYALSGVWNVPSVDGTYAAGEEVGFIAGEAAAAGTGSYSMEAKTTSSSTLAVMINGNPG